MAQGARTAVAVRTQRPAMTRTAAFPVTAAALVGLVGLAAVLRFATLTQQSYWLDEAQAAHELGLSFGRMLGAWNSAEWNPPLYLILAWPWARIFGTGEAGLRALSALLGTALVPLVYLSGRELVSRRAGLAAAALAAVNPFMIWYSQEAREYMLLVVLCTAGLLFFARARRTHHASDVWLWALFSALALLTQYFAGFIIAVEGILLLVWIRRWTTLAACAVQILVLAPLIPHVIPRLQAPALFITGQPLALRIQQVPIAFGLNTLYQTSLVSDGLIVAAVLVAVLVALLVGAAGGEQLRGAGIAALIAGFVVLVPLLLALVGHDDFIARALMPAWPPLAIVVGAACTARGARIPGAALLAVLLGVFVWGLTRVDGDPSLQRPNWRGVATALGKTRAARAIVAYDGEFATAPLSFYLPRVAWAGPGMAPGTDTAPVTIRELDIVGEVGDQVNRSPGLRLLASRRVDGYLVERFGLPGPWSATPAMIDARAQAAVSPAPAGPLLPLIQPAPAHPVPAAG
jgi:hypothetical protein